MSFKLKHICLSGSLLLSTALHSAVLLDFNQGDQQSMTGWQWLDDVAYGNAGWVLDYTDTFGAANTYYWGVGPRSFNKADYGKNNTALIDTSQRAPGSSGGSLLVTENASSTEDHRTSWWLWYDGQPLSSYNITDATTDRFSFYLKTEGMTPLTQQGVKTGINTNFHIGTYLCWPSETGSAYGSGDGCPYEGPGNQHYYHYLNIDSGAWIHVLLDQHPQHRRNSSVVGNNPSYILSEKHYFAQLNQMYMEIRYAQPERTKMWIDEVQFYSTQDQPEPQQNDDSVTSLWIGYWPEQQQWRLGFNDMSFTGLDDYSIGSYEIRWSEMPITNQNYADAQRVTPQLYAGSKYVDSAHPSYFRRPNSWRHEAFTTFTLPISPTTTNKTLYFAVKDVSVKDQHAGTQWPWNKGDGHDAASPFIKTIDYQLQAPAASPTLLWRNLNSGAHWQYVMQGAQRQHQYAIKQVANDWQLVGRADFNQDGHLDLLWRHQDGQNWIDLRMDATQLDSLAQGQIAPEWQVVGLADSNADATDDIFWRNRNTGALWLHQMQQGQRLSSQPIATVSTDWQIEAIGDINGDQAADIIWRHQHTGQLWVYQLDGAHIQHSYALNQVDLNWQCGGLGDFNGDGQQDILWRHRNTGQNWLYLMQAGQISQSIPLNQVADLQWQVALIDDLNQDGNDDIVWRHQQTGQNWLYQMQQGQIQQALPLPTVSDSAWQLVNNQP